VNEYYYFDIIDINSSNYFSTFELEPFDFLNP